MSEDKDQLTNHEYDGIKEYDNPLPNWWLVTFFGTIIFGFIYWIHYTSGSGPTLSEELQTAMNEIQSAQTHVQHSEMSEAELEEKLKDADMQAAAVIYKARCEMCHGDNLQGMIGPNLTDEYWLHGKGSAKDIISIIQIGVPEKGMPPWSAMLKDDEIIALVSYVIKKQDSHPANAKAPQGEKVR